MNQKLQPALLGGLLIGVLSALPFVSMCCCLWVIAGGVLTTYLLQERLTTPVTAGDATIAGLLAGVIGAMLSTVLSQLMAIARGVTVADGINELLGQGRLPPEMTGALEQVRDMPSAVFMIGALLVTLFIYPIFSMLGALLGVALFKRQPPPPPPGTVEILPPE
jgi:ABC-type phosphate transport system permease subunit